MFGTNPIRPPVQGDGSELQVQSIFPTLQGEGPYAGWPAIFIRLGGCNLACDFCDTEFESFRAMTLEDILADVGKLGHGRKPLIVLTGGEPLRQPIAALCEGLIAAGHKIQIETNGTLFRPLPEGVEIICSPKNGGSGYYPVRPDLLQRAMALKFLVSASHPLYREVPDVGQGGMDIPIYVQPMDEREETKNTANRQLAVALVQKHGYRLSLQLHKILGIE